MTQTLESHDVPTTEAIGQALASHLDANAIVLIEGDLGAGKTVFVRGLAAGLGLDAEAVQSPTFTIVHEHGAPLRLVHVDLYRLTPEETESIGIDELLAGPGVKAIEWAERLPMSPPSAVRVRIEHAGAAGRRVTIDGEPRDVLIACAALAGASGGIHGNG